MPQRSMASRAAIPARIIGQVNASAAPNAQKTGDDRVIQRSLPPKGLAYALLPPSAWGMETPQAPPSEEIPP